MVRFIMISMKKTILAGLITGVGLIVGGIGFWVKKTERIERLIAEKLDCGCEIENVKIDFMSQPMTVEISGLKLFQKEGDASPVVTVPKGSFTLTGLVVGEKIIDDLILENPNIHLEVTEVGANWELGRKKTKGEVAPGKDKSDKIPNEGLAGLRKISLTGGTITYLNAEKQLFATCEDVNVSAENASNGVFTLETQLSARGAEAENDFLVADLQTTITLATQIEQPDILIETAFSEGSYIGRDFPSVQKVWGLVDKLRDFGLSMKNVPEQLALKSDKQLRCEVNDDEIKLLTELPLRSKKGWGLSVAEGATFHPKTTEHNMTIYLGADAERSADLKRNYDRFVSKLPRPARAIAEEKIGGFLFKNDLLSVQYISKGPLTKPSVKSLNPLPKLKELVSGGVDGLLKGLFKR